MCRKPRSGLDFNLRNLFYAIRLSNGKGFCGSLGVFIGNGVRHLIFILDGVGSARTPLGYFYSALGLGNFLCNYSFFLGMESSSKNNLDIAQIEKTSGPSVALYS